MKPALLLLLLVACAPLPATRPSLELRVLVYNIHAGKDAARADNLQRVAAIVREARADVVLLQEVDSMTTRSGGVDQLAALARRTGMHGAYGSTLEFQGGAYGLGVLSRFPIASRRLVVLPSDPPAPRSGTGREPRGAFIVVVTTPIGPVHVIDTHLDASADDRWRREEALAVVTLADSLSAAGARLLVGGDFNTTPGSFVHAIVADALLRDAWGVCGDGTGFTFPAAEPVRRIDYLFLSPASTCLAARVIPTDASDHLPVAVDVRIR